MAVVAGKPQPGALLNDTSIKLFAERLPRFCIALLTRTNSLVGSPVVWRARVRNDGFNLPFRVTDQLAGRVEVLFGVQFGGGTSVVLGNSIYEDFSHETTRVFRSSTPSLRRPEPGSAQTRHQRSNVAVSLPSAIGTPRRRDAPQTNRQSRTLRL